MRARRPVIEAGCLAIGLFLATPATGAIGATTQSAFHRSGANARGFEQSSNWSGFAVTGSTYTRVSGSWQVPAVTITGSNRYAADWVGIGGYSGADLIQAGTSEESVNGHAKYYAWTEILPAPESKISGFAVHPGDAVHVDINLVSTASWTIVVSNHTTGQTSTTNVNYASTESSAEWIHEAPTVGGSQSQLATTTNADFDHGLVNGSTPVGSAGVRHRIQLVGPTDATPSKLDSDHDGFAVRDGSSAPPPPSS